MTTATTSARVRHDSDAVYREWVQEIHDQFVAIGLVQTADTGQANIAALTRPAAGVYNAYEVWGFNDSLQGSAPIYLKTEYGTSNAGATGAVWRVGFGTGTNGAGTLTATGINGTSPVTPNTVNFQQGGFPNADTLRDSHYCHTEGFLGVSWKNVTTGFGLPGMFTVSRTVDADGVPDGRGMLIDWPKGNGGNPVRQAVRFTPEPFGFAQNTTTPDNYLGFAPQAPASSAVGSDHRIYSAWTFCNGAEPIHGLVGVYPAQQAAGTTFSLAMLGATSHTYRVIHNYPFGHPTSMLAAMLWE